MGVEWNHDLACSWDEAQSPEAQACMGLRWLNGLTAARRRCSRTRTAKVSAGGDRRPSAVGVRLVAAGPWRSRAGDGQLHARAARRLPRGCA